MAGHRRAESWPRHLRLRLHDVVPNRIADETINITMRSALTGPRLDKEHWRRVIPCMPRSHPPSAPPYTGWRRIAPDCTWPHARGNRWSRRVRHQVVGVATIIDICRTPSHTARAMSNGGRVFFFFFFFFFFFKKTCFYVRDVDALYAEFLRSGAEIQGEPVSQRWGLREFSIRDTRAQSADVRANVRNAR